MSAEKAFFRGGYWCRMLVVDLSTRRITVEDLDGGAARLFLGSRGLNSCLLYQRMKPGSEPLEPDNVLIFGNGPLTGTAFPAAARYTVTARSPLTGLLGDANSGGYFGPELKAAGWDHVIITGRSDRPCVLWIIGERVELRDADELWGLDTWKTTGALQVQAGDSRIRVACIGPAGERLVRYACIINDRNRAAGRTGMGAVMGSKRLKAIAVRGHQRTVIADPESFRETVRRLNDQVHRDPGFPARSTYGTASLMGLSSAEGIESTRNHQSGWFEGHEFIGAEALSEGFWQESTGCYGCTIRCSHNYRVTEGPYAGTVGEGPEYETLNAFGSKLGIDNLPAILRANTLANQYGLDTMSLGTTISFAMECYEQGLLNLSDTGGLDLRWGNQEAMLALIEQIVCREGLGDVLAEGSRRAAAVIGPAAGGLAMHVKGMELPAMDPRASYAKALSYAVSSRGGDHLRAGFVKVEKKWKAADGLREVGAAEAADPNTPAGKAAMVGWEEDLTAVVDSLGICLFTSSSLLAIKMSDIATAFSQAIGVSVSESDLWQAGKRITTLERAFNLREGLQAEQDTLPERFLTEPLPAGPAEGRIVTELERLVQDYYALRGWDGCGVPTPATLQQLGLSELFVQAASA